MGGAKKKRNNPMLDIHRYNPKIPDQWMNPKMTDSLINYGRSCGNKSFENVLTFFSFLFFFFFFFLRFPTRNHRTLTSYRHRLLDKTIASVFFLKQRQEYFTFVSQWTRKFVFYESRLQDMCINHLLSMLRDSLSNLTSTMWARPQYHRQRYCARKIAKSCLFPESISLECKFVPLW